MDCCGGAHHEITVQAGSSNLTLIRCGQCSQQAWTIDGRPIDRDQAFAHLSGAYREIPRAAQAARARTTADRDARRAARAARLTAEVGQPEGVDQEIRLTDEPVAAQLADLLKGWQVLGAVS